MIKTHIEDCEAARALHTLARRLVPATPLTTALGQAALDPGALDLAGDVVGWSPFRFLAANQATN